MGIAVGIDLGTTNSCVAVVQNNRARVLEDNAGRRIHPSILSFLPDGKVVAGHAAKDRRLSDPQNTVHSSKRLIGRNLASEDTRKILEELPYKVAAGPDGIPVVSVRNRQVSLPEVSALMLQHLKTMCFETVNMEINQAVITVPANFDDVQRSSTKVAGRIAGFDVLRIINEPTAAALAYGFGGQRTERIAVYDFGGGTFDITIVELSDDIFEVLSTAGEPYLGGEDFDKAVMGEMLREFKKTHKVDLAEDPAALQRLRAAAERVKCQLSTLGNVQATLQNITTTPKGKKLDFFFKLSRERFEELVSPFVERSLTVCNEALKLAGLKATDLHNLVMVGGTTRVPLVRKRTAEVFGVVPRTEINPDEVVAIGAAIQAFSLTGEQLPEVLPPRTKSPVTQPPPRRKQPPPVAPGPDPKQKPVEASESLGLDVRKAKPTAGQETLGLDVKRPKPAAPAETLGLDVKRPNTATAEAESLELDVKQAKPIWKTEPLGLDVKRSKPNSPPDNLAVDVKRPSMSNISDVDLDLEPKRPDLDLEPKRPDLELEPKRPDLDVEPKRPDLELEPKRPDLDVEPKRPDLDLEPKRPDLELEPKRPDLDLEPKHGSRDSSFDSDSAAASGMGDAYSMAADSEFPFELPDMSSDAKIEDESMFSVSEPPADFDWDIPEAEATEEHEEFSVPPSLSSPPEPTVEEDEVGAVPGFETASLPPPSGHTESPASVEVTDAARARGALLLDVTPRALGLAVAGGFCDIVIERNAAIPVEQSRLFTTSTDDQREVSIDIYQGESRRVEDNTKLGHILLSNLRAAPRGAVKIRVTFEIDTDGILGVSAKNEESNEAESTKIVLTGGMDEETVQALVRQYSTK